MAPLPVIDAAILLAIGCLVWAVAPQPQVHLPSHLVGGAAQTPLARFLGQLRRLSNPVLLVTGRWMTRPGVQEDALKDRLAYIGSSLGPVQFNGLRIMGAMLGVFAGAVLARELGAAPVFILLIAAAVGWIVPAVWLRAKMGKRQRAMVRLLPEVIDLLILCIGAGLDFLGALNKVVIVRAFQREPLIEELSVTLQEIKFGKRRSEALKALSRRVRIPEMGSFVRTLVQADRMGTPMSEVLTVHSEDVRFERYTRAERTALKAPIKILIPLIFCILPCVAILVGAPVFLQFMQQTPFGK